MNFLGDFLSGLTGTAPNNSSVSIANLLGGNQLNPIDFVGLEQLKNQQYNNIGAGENNFANLFKDLGRSLTMPSKPGQKGLSALFGGIEDARNERIFTEPKRRADHQNKMLEDLSKLMGDSRKLKADEDKDLRRLKQDQDQFDSKLDYQTKKDRDQLDLDTMYKKGVLSRQDRELDIKDFYNRGLLDKKDIVESKLTKVSPTDITNFKKIVEENLDSGSVPLAPALKNKILSAIGKHYRSTGDSQAAYDAAIAEVIGDPQSLTANTFREKPGFFKDTNQEYLVVAPSPEELSDTRSVVDTARKAGKTNKQIKEVLHQKGISKEVMKQLGL